MENIAVDESFSLLLKNSAVSGQMGVSVVSLGRLSAMTEYHCRGRVRNDYLLLLTLDGSAWVKEGKRKKQLQKGSWFLLRPGIVHSYRELAPWSFAYVHFHGNTVDRVINGLSFFKRETLGFKQASGASKELLLRLVSGAADATVPGEILRNAILLELLTSLHSNYRKSNSDFKALSMSYEYILENLEKDLDLPRLAEIAGISQFHFVRNFKEKYGYPPVHFVQKMRIEKAKELLRREPDTRKIADISELCGFKDPLYFSKVFKHWTDMSPKAFRLYIKQHNPV